MQRTRDATLPSWRYFKSARLSSRIGMGRHGTYMMFRRTWGTSPLMPMADP